MAASAQATATQRGNQLHELNKTTAHVIDLVLKVVYSDVVEYTYVWNQENKTSYKLRTVLNSLDEGHYCLGVMKPLKGDKKELDEALKKNGITDRSSA